MDWHSAPAQQMLYLVWPAQKPQPQVDGQQNQSLEQATSEKI